MAPGLPAGTRVRVVPVEPAALRPGDVVLLGAGPRRFLHRFLARRGDGPDAVLVCKGDRLRWPDPPWPVSALLGRAYAIEIDREVCPLRVSRGRRWCAWASGVLLPLLYCLRHGGWPEPWVVFRAFHRLWALYWRPGSAAAARVLQLRLRALAAPEKGAAVERIRIEVGPLPGPPRLSASASAVELVTDRVAVQHNRAARQGVLRLGAAEAAGAGVEALLRTAGAAMMLADGGLCLHASAVVGPDGSGALVFAGPSGAGKTTAAHAFGRACVLDEDFVALLPAADGGWWRVPSLPPADPGTPAPAAECLPVRAIYLPARSERFALEPLEGGSAVLPLFHLPEALQTPEAADRALAALARLVAAVPVYRLRWAQGMDLPALLRQTGSG